MLLAPMAGSQTPSGKDVVAPEAYASKDPVARGMSMQVAIVMKIRPGFHVNAREVTQDYLQTFAFSKDKKLNVYTDTVVIKMPLTVLAGAPLGAQHLPLKLHFQACSNEICLPPVTKDVDATINIVANPSAAKSANAQYFK